MEIRSIEGKWAGQFKYDEGYPMDIQGRYVSFTIELWEINAAINGICIDDHTTHLEIAPATILGSFKDNRIEFVKTYPHFFTFNNKAEAIVIPGTEPYGIMYTGKLRKRLFSNEYYFKGKSEVTFTYQNKMGLSKTHHFRTIWSMKKVS